MSGSITSPLTLQMLMANGGAMGVPQDPAVAAALPRLQLAQSMMQSGMSTAPTEKYGALSRVAQAMLGNVMFDKANTGLQDILTQRAQQAGAANSYIMGGEQNAPGTAPAIPAPTPVATGATTPPVSTFGTQLASSEGKPGSVNGQGFSGQFQFGADRLASTGLYSPAQGEDLKANQWKGTFNIPGFPDVKTQKDFLANTGAQNAALGVDIQNTDKAIANTPGAGAYDQNGLRAVAHLGGVGGMQKFIESNGQYNPADSNGTSLSDYYHKFSGSGSPPAAAPGNPSISAPAPGTAPAGPNPWEVIRRAGSVLTNPAFQYNPQAQAAAQHAIDTAKLQISTGSYSETKPGVYQDAYSGKPMFAPSPRMATDVHGNLIAASGGGQTTMVSPNASGMSGNSPESNAMRTVAEIGPLIQAGTATPQQAANYNTALPIYQGFKTVTSSPGQTVTAVPTREPPIGAPPPVAAGNAPPEAQGPLPTAAPAPRIPQGGASMPPALTPEMPAATSPTGPHVVVPPNPSAIAGQASAAAQGSETGKAAAVLPSQLVKLGGESDTAIGNIDYGLSQLHQAAAGGINAGYFAPWLATAAAAGKSLGVNLQSMGIDPNAVGNVQSAQKTLGVVAGSILQNTLGKDSAITDAKIEHFIHTQPGIETDPDAIGRVLNWARSQFVFNRNMAMDAMNNVDPNTGMLHPGWQASFYKKTGAFAPIYDPLNQEMAQPQGQGPAAHAPASPQQTTPQAPATAPPTPSLDDVKAEMRRRGLMK